MFLDGRRKRAKLLPFGNAMHLAVALWTEIPQPLVMHSRGLGGVNEARGRLCLIDGPIAMDFRAARLRLWVRSQRLRCSLGMIEAVAVAVNGIAVVSSQKLRVEHGGGGALRRIGAHALAPFRIWAIWMNLRRTPMRSAQPC